MTMGEDMENYTSYLIIQKLASSDIWCHEQYLLSHNIFFLVISYNFTQIWYFVLYYHKSYIVM
jgi:hypothetical protein